MDSFSYDSDIRPLRREHFNSLEQAWLDDRSDTRFAPTAREQEREMQNMRFETAKMEFQRKRRESQMQAEAMDRLPELTADLDRAMGIEDPVKRNNALYAVSNRFGAVAAASPLASQLLNGAFQHSRSKFDVWNTEQQKQERLAKEEAQKNRAKQAALMQGYSSLHDIEKVKEIAETMDYVDPELEQLGIATAERSLATAHQSALAAQQDAVMKQKGALVGKYEKDLEFLRGSSTSLKAVEVPPEKEGELPKKVYVLPDRNFDKVVDIAATLEYNSEAGRKEAKRRGNMSFGEVRQEIYDKYKDKPEELVRLAMNITRAQRDIYVQPTLDIDPVGKLNDPRAFMAKQQQQPAPE